MGPGGECRREVQGDAGATLEKGDRRLGSRLGRGKERPRDLYSQPSVQHQAPARAERPPILVLGPAAGLLLPGILSPEGGATQECKGKVGGGVNKGC